MSVLIGSIQKFSVDDGPGIRTTIFFKGCPLNCSWCHNPELIDSSQQLIMSPNNCIGCGHCVGACPLDAISIQLEKGVAIDRNRCAVCLKCADECYANALRPVAREMSIEDILKIAQEDKGFYDNTGGGITLSGGEVLMHVDAARRIIEGAASRKINVCLDTSGFGSGTELLELARYANVTDILYDIKSVDDQIHKEYTGVSNKVILDNLRMLANDELIRKKVNIRMPLIGGVNDSDKLIDETVKLLATLGVKKLTLLPYHNLGISKMRNIGGDQREFQTPADSRMEAIKQTFEKIKDLQVTVSSYK